MTVRRAAWIGTTKWLQAGAALCAVPAVFAAPEPTTPARSEPIVVEEVVVTATKRAEPLQDVPLAVSAITAQDIQAKGFTQFADYLNTVPGVYFTDNGPGSSQIRIRGLTAAEGGVASTTATYFGESIISVLTNQGGKPNLRLVDIDRVEVLRGPQGTLFGANALAGVMRIIPAAPDPTEFVVNVGTRGFTTAHSADGSYHVEGTVNLPLVQDRLALRVVGYKDDVAGYIDNVVPAQPAVDYSAALGLPDGLLVTPAVNAFTRKDVNSEDTYGGRAALEWRASDAFKLNLTHIMQSTRLDSEPFTQPSAGDYVQSRAMDVYEPGEYTERLDVTTFVASYDWERATVLSSSNWARMRRSRNQDITFLAEAAFGAPIPWDLRDGSWGRLFTQEVRVQSRGDGPFQWTFGGFYLKQKSDLSQVVPDFSCPACLPELLAGQDFALSLTRKRFGEEEQKAGFTDLSYALTPRWTVGGGVRYLKEDLVSVDISADGILAPPTLEDVRDKGSYTETNPSAYVRFKPVEDLTLYAQYGRGFRSGQVNPGLPPQCQDELQAAGGKAITSPDTLKNYELGLKTHFADGRVGLNTAVFEQKWDGVQLGVSFTCGYSTIINGGDAKGRGVELEVAAQPIDAWRLNASFSYVKNKFDHVAPGVGYEHDERLPDAPVKNASLGAQYDFPLSATWSGFARADLTYVGDVLTKFTTAEITQPSFTTTNARLGLRKDNLAMELYGRNLADKRAVMTTSNVDYGDPQQVLLRPREVGVELRYSFR